MGMKVYTIGHSTHELDEFVHILQAYGVNFLVDIRTVPRSRRVPQFNKESLPLILKEHGIEYRHLSALGGLRNALPDSTNKAWRNMSFRGYADYMQTKEFEEGLHQLMELASEHVVAIMCAEAVPWRCHRSLVGDALLVRGVGVEDIFSATTSTPEKITNFATVDGLKITYPAEDA